MRALCRGYDGRIGVKENLSNSTIESLVCGAPVDGIHIGAKLDIYDHQINGCLAKLFKQQV